MHRLLIGDVSIEQAFAILREKSNCSHKTGEVEMKKLFLAVFICAIAGFSLMGCGKKASHEHPAGHEDSAEHPQ